MIPLLDIATLERAIGAYLVDRFEEEEVTVRQANGEAANQFATISPPIVYGAGGENEPARSPVVVVICNNGPAEIPGVYGGDEFGVHLVVTTPILIPGLGEGDHGDLFAQILAAFPNRAANGAEDEDWQAVHEAIDAKIHAVTPYHLTGFYAEAGQVQKSKDRIEQAVRFCPGLMHESLVGD